jgi:dolichol-phosphate mannosyltransferase
MTDLSIVVPVFNEEECIESSFDRLTASIQNSALNSKVIEFVFVNDGSKDKTPEILDSFKARSDSKVSYKVLHFSRNFGHSSAVLAGLEASTGKLVAIIDADMQDPPELIPDMVKKIDEGFDVVYGLRLSREGETFVKKMTAWFFYRVINTLASIDIPKDAGDFRVITREVVDAVLSCHDQAPFVRGLVAWVGFKQFPFGYHREERKLGTTKYPLKKMIKFAWQAISSFSNTPLLFITYLGLGMTFISLLIGFWALKQYVNGEVIPGWTSLLLGFLAGNAVTLLMLGIMGLYLGKIIDQVRGRPRYIIKKVSR